MSVMALTFFTPCDTHTANLGWMAELALLSAANDLDSGDQDSHAQLLNALYEARQGPACPVPQGYQVIRLLLAGVPDFL